MRVVLVVLFGLVGSLAACGSDVDVDGLPSIADYQNWERTVEVYGPAPGHGDTYRSMFANDIAGNFTGAGLYPIGSIIVKEIRNLDGESSPGDINYFAVMRKLDEAPPGGSLDDGWLYTIFDAIGDTEINSARCFDTCHQAAPMDGTFFDWSSAQPSQ